MEVLKFKDLCDKNCEVDVKNDDLVIDVKRKLSKKINEFYKNIIFMFKSEILFDDKLISDYKIELNQFVLWIKGKDCVRFSNSDSDTIKCITIIDSRKDCEYFVNMNKRSTIRMLKSIIAKKYKLEEDRFYLEFKKNKLLRKNDSTLEQCGFRNGCNIKLTYNDIIKVIIVNKYFRNFSETFEYNLSKYSTIGQLKQNCVEKTNIDLNKFSLYLNEKCLLNDDATLEQYRLRNGCTIALNSCNIIPLCIKHDDACYAIYANKCFSVWILKQLIDEIIHVRPRQIKLHYNNAELRNDHQLNDYWINNGDTLNLTIVTSSWGSILCDVTMIPLSDKYEPFTITEISDINDLISKIYSKYQIIDSFIKLYSDVNKIDRIDNDGELRNLLYENTNSKKNTIYCEIITQKQNFELIELLGQGSFGVVHKCRNEKTNQILALKEFDLSKDSVSLKSNFRGDIDCYFKLKCHPRIIKFENHFINEHRLCIVMEFMERGSLGSYVKGKEPFSESVIAKFARQILEGLEYLHEYRILHSNLKGDNILLDENDNLKLCDFGLTKMLTDISSENFLNGVVQSTIRNINWMSPEIIIGESYRPASDIWSFGATMVEIITRKHPHEGLAIGKVVSNIIAGKLKCRYPPNSSDDMKSFINSCLKINCKERAKIKQLFYSAFLMKNLN